MSHRTARRTKVPDSFGGFLRQIWELPLNLDVHIKAGSRFYVGGPEPIETGVTAFDEISGEVNAGQHATVSSDTIVSGNLKADSGDAKADALQSITGDVEAGLSATLTAGTDAQVQDAVSQAVSVTAQGITMSSRLS